MSDPLTEDEANELMRLKMDIVHGTEKAVKQIRRKLRNRIFRINQGRDGFDNGLSKVLKAQFHPDMNMNNFTFNWDLSPKDPLKVVTVFEWKEEGGTFETMNVQCDDGIIRPEKICSPTAFTKQE